MLFNLPLIRGLGQVLPCALIGICVSAGILWALLWTGLAWRLATDIPNERSLHTRPTPRVGGWGLIPAIILPVILYAPDFRLFALGAFVLAVISQVDDRRGLPARVRFAAHLLIVVAGIVLSTVTIDWWLAILAVLALVWVVNLYNFMDGSDGLAGGMALFGFGFYALAALHAHPSLAAISAGIAGAALGFLIFNRHPARIFLGDAGSIPLGFLAGALGFWGWQHSIWPIWFPPLVFAPFVADATVTLSRRFARGEKVWVAHREHYYQRLVRITGSHTRVAFSYYLLMLCGGLLALTALHTATAMQWVIFTIWYGFLAILGLRVDRQWRSFILNKGSDAI